MDTLDRLTAEGMELGATREYDELRGGQLTPQSYVPGTLSDAMRDELLAILVAKHEAIEAAKATIVDLSQHAEQAEAEVAKYVNACSIYADTVRELEAEVATLKRMLRLAALDYANRPTAAAPTSIGAERWLADLRDRAGSGE